MATNFHSKKVSRISMRDNHVYTTRESDNLKRLYQTSYARRKNHMVNVYQEKLRLQTPMSSQYYSSQKMSGGKMQRH